MNVVPFLMCVLVASSPLACAESPGFGGGELRIKPPAGAAQDCISPDDRATIDAAVAAHFEFEDDGLRGASFPRMPFFPQAGRIHRDLIVTNYVDLNSSSGIRDWNCGSITYNGHGGHDTVVRSFAEQEIGTPVFAPLDGVVLGIADGNPDMNTTWGGQPANFVVLSHGQGVVSYLYHLKNGSVSVAAGEQVRAGQQIGLTASSGNSTYPHLHFEVHENGLVREPSAGSCRPGSSLWINQDPVNPALTVFDAGITGENLEGHPGLPWSLPRSGQIAHNDPRITLWVQVNQMPAATSWQLVLYRPDGSIASNSSGTFNNNPAYTWSWWWWSRLPGSMLGQTGTARMELSFNGQRELVAEFEVVSVVDPSLNRNPADVSAALSSAGALSGRAPWVDEAIACEITVDLVNDDPDYDVVRYEYVWEVNGAEVRRVTTAAHSDILAAGMAQAGDMVQCTVTPSDGRGGVGGSTTALVEVLGACPNDTNGDRVVNFTDLNAALSAFGQTSGVGGLPPDINLDGVVNFTDLNAILSAFGDECE